MEIYLNGKPRELDGALTIAELVQELGVAGRRIAVEVNQDIVPRSSHATRRLEPGDRVEIVHAIGGG
jgi:sulfur carrier protein